MIEEMHLEKKVTDTQAIYGLRKETERVRSWNNIFPLYREKNYNANLAYSQQYLYRQNCLSTNCPLYRTSLNPFPSANQVSLWRDGNAEWSLERDEPARVLNSGRCGDPFGDHPTRGASQVGFRKNERMIRSYWNCIANRNQEWNGTCRISLFD